jgi:hypothetical protein
MELNWRQRRHLISIIPAIAQAIALNRSALHPAQRNDSFNAFSSPPQCGRRLMAPG